MFETTAGIGGLSSKKRLSTRVSEIIRFVAGHVSGSGRIGRHATSCVFRVIQHICRVFAAVQD